MPPSKERKKLPINITGDDGDNRANTNSMPPGYSDNPSKVTLPPPTPKKPQSTPKPPSN